MSTLREELRWFQEPKLGVVSHRDPADHSSDNGPLHTITAYLLLPDRTRLETEWLDELVGLYEAEPGTYRRYPGDPNFMSHDDYTAIAVLFRHRAIDIYDYGVKHGWVFPGVGSLARIPDFVPTIKAAAGIALLPEDEHGVTLGFLGNALASLPIWGRLPFQWAQDFYEPKSKTSGRCLLWLKARRLLGTSRWVNFVLYLWAYRMAMLYPGGLAELYGIYFGVDHPIAKYAQKDFEITEVRP